MSENLNDIKAVFEKKRLENETIIKEVLTRFETIFPDKDQCEVISELYQQIFRITNDIEEINVQSMYISSFIDAFQAHLVGDGKLISEAQYIEEARKAFQESIDQVTKAYKEMAENSPSQG